jgi:hypothetical protein
VADGYYVSIGQRHHPVYVVIVTCDGEDQTFTITGARVTYCMWYLKGEQEEAEKPEEGYTSIECCIINYQKTPSKGWREKENERRRRERR